MTPSWLKRTLRKRTLDNHPLATETRRAMRKARVKDAVEVIDLQASELACDVADAWVGARDVISTEYDDRGAVKKLDLALDRLELVTRPSAMRKVRP